MDAKTLMAKNGQTIRKMENTRVNMKTKKLTAAMKNKTRMKNSIIIFLPLSGAV